MTADKIAAVDRRRHTGKLFWELMDDGLNIRLLKEPSYGYSFPIRITFKDKIPQPPITSK